MAQLNVSNNLFTKGFGGTDEKAVSDPYLSGYAFFRFERVPMEIFGNPEVPSDIVKILSATGLAVTLPTVDLNKTTIRGQGGTKWSVPTDLTLGDTVSIRYVEISSLPITNFHQTWVNLIRDIRTGASNMEGDNYTKGKYSANLLYWTTKPDGKTIEKAFYMTGIFPQRIPVDSHNYDVNTVDRVEIEITYNVDNLYIYTENMLFGNTFVKAKAEGYTNEILEYRNYLRTYAS